MSNDKYVGLDVHQASVVAAVLNAQGKCVCQSVLETRGPTIVDFITGLGGALHVTFEEGTQSAWLYDLIRPLVAKLVVCDPRKNRLLVGENKSDRVDANNLAHRPRLGELQAVYKGEAGLRRLKELVHSYDSLVSDTTRVRNRIKASKRGGNNRKKAVRELQAAHAHVRNQRSDFHHKVSRWLICCFGLIVIEDLNVKGLASGMLAKSVNDAGWSSFIDKLAYKAEEAGRVLMRVDARGTSPRSTCGAAVPKRLRQRWHEGLGCGLSAGRDRGFCSRNLKARTSPVRGNVGRWAVRS